ncbi:MAG: CHASE2 domain-containing protein [Cyanomargarita calcarea GSE-NOS-MK-12-04C]|jgi:CHASE2 domain-containing sensor protein|uniref:CHASE2 domain-containing protein n=1 Tax=Cyanomargarita calcarea GSE-NOS-MK-12-04C TaxID=2839659 RepID=A0A951QN26_9CYAN|nr:CHASE2 domain-containing protein [Cyanomargarita calcarea GSE-NOS-MK-12-04C]
MSKLVVLNLGQGDLKTGFPVVTVQLWDENVALPTQFTGSLPPAPQLAKLYRSWQLLYYLLYETPYQHPSWQKRMEIEENIEIEKEDVTNVSSIEFNNLCNELQNSINIWLKSKYFRSIDQKIRTKLASTDDIRVIIQTECEQVRRIPWHLWDFLDDYQSSEVCLSTQDFDRVKVLHKTLINKVRILAILGNSKGIDINKDRVILEELPGSEVVFLVEPKRQELDRWLWDKSGWDILFFAGHSSSRGESATGRIYINPTDSLTISQLKNSLKAAITPRGTRYGKTRSLSLAIFNSCDGLGLVPQLASLDIPQVIVMREGIPDLIAHEFLKHFLSTFADGECFYLAVRQAREKLQGLENNFPCASWLPVICQNPSEAPLVWTKNISEQTRQRLKFRRVVPLIGKISIIVTILIIVIRSLSLLQPYELSAFDSLMRLRPEEAPDNRILIVTITNTDVQSQPVRERGSASLSDKTLAQLLAKLLQMQPRVIGLDIYRENAVKSEFADLAKTLQQNDKFIAICKISEESKDAGVSPPPEVPTHRLGFSDAVIDSDNIIRRQLLALSPISPCNTDKSLSFQLATIYLASENIHPTLNQEKNLQFGNTVFQNLEENSGGYHGVDNLGHQVMLNWRSSDLVAKQVTLADVLNNQLASELVKNRVVLIGTVAESFQDYWSTPYSAGKFPHEEMPGVVVQAHMVSQILSATLDNRPLIWFLSKWSEALWIWCWAIVGGVISWHFQSTLGFRIAGGITIIILSGVCLGLLIQGAWVPLVPSVLAIIASSTLLRIAIESIK